MRKLLSLALNLSTLAAIGFIIYSPANNWWAIVPAVVWFILHGPFAIYALPGMPLTLSELEVLPDGLITAPESDEWARRFAGEFAPHGFIPRARFRSKGAPAIDFAQRFDNSVTGEVATIMAGRRPAPDGNGVVPLRIVVFHTRFREGELLTTNSYISSMSPRFPGQRAYRLSDVENPSVLYSLHRRLAKHDGRKPVPIVLGEDPLAWERLQHDRSIATQVGHGLGVKDEKTGRLRLTLKGAFRSTWLLHPLLTGFQDRRALKEAASVLRATLRTAPA
jgi:hypothetical protein